MERTLNSQKISISKVIINILFIIVSFFCIIPVLLVLSVSLTNENSLLVDGYHLIPKQFSTAAYIYVFGGSTSILDAYKVTVFVTVMSTFLHLLITSMMSYSLTRREVRYKNIISFIIYFTLLFNGGLVPYYILVTKYLHLKDTIIILIVVHLMSAGNVLIMKNYFRTIPDSIIESARIDGSGEIKTFFRIIIPLSTPSLATIGLFVAIASWNDWFTCSLYIQNTKLYTLQYLLQSLMSNIQYLQSNEIASQAMERMLGTLPGESARMATCIVSIGPIILLYPFLQKYFVKGLTLGAVKE